MNVLSLTALDCTLPPANRSVHMLLLKKQCGTGKVWTIFGQVPILVDTGALLTMINTQLLNAMNLDLMS